MSSESRRLRWWHWLLVALALILILTYVGTYTLEPRKSLSVGVVATERE